MLIPMIVNIPQKITYPEIEDFASKVTEGMDFI